jgi:ElaB/YqjD/DUF883 family membrane-anchored ribosome-binding protein
MAVTTLTRPAAVQLKSANAELQRMKDAIEATVRNTVAPTVAEIVAKAAASAMQGQKQVQDYSETVSGGVRNRPLLSILLAAGVGFVAGRITAGGK